MVENQKKFCAVVFGGFILGILYTNLFASDYLAMTGVFSGYYLQNFASNSVKIEECILFIIRIRLLPLVILMLMAYSRINKIGIIVFLLWTGLLSGIYMSLGVLQLGLKGVMFCVLGLFPHMMFYLPAYMIVMVFVYKYPMSQWNVVKVAVVSMCMVSGVVLECQVSPYILKWLIAII